MGLSIIAPYGFTKPYVDAISVHLPRGVGYFVLGAFLPLMFRGRSCPLPTWIDRLGWVVGLLWIVMALLTWVQICLFMRGIA